MGAHGVADRRVLSRRAVVTCLFTGAAGVLLLAVAGCRPSTPTTKAGISEPTSQGTPLTSQPELSTTAKPASSTPPPTATVQVYPVYTAVSPTSVPALSVATPSPSTPIQVGGWADLAIARGASPGAITKAAVEAIGGIARFVPKGSTVLIKPNICVSRPPEYAATTNPEVVEALVRLCREAGAATVKVLDYGFSGQRTSYTESGIEAAVKRAGGEMIPITPLKWKRVTNPKAKEAKILEVFEDVLTADVVINVPIAKHHGLARLTLGMKNLMGTIRYREPFHGSLGQQLSDLALLIKPAFTVVDAVRILLRNGPQGGDLADVKRMDTVIASTDIVAVDAYASTLFGLKPDELETVRAGQRNGLGTYDLGSLRIAEVKL